MSEVDKEFRQDSGEDPPFVKTKDGFEVHVDTGDFIDDSYIGYPVIYKYKIVGETLLRVPPIAISKATFVTQWLRSPWKEAKRWSAQQYLSDLWSIHTEYGDVYRFGDIREARHCSDNPHHYQVEVDWDPPLDEMGEKASRYDTITPMFFQFSGRNNIYTMTDATNRPDWHCDKIVDRDK